MSWNDAAKTKAIAVSRERDTTDGRLFKNTPPPGWNPHEVWLTRIQQPRAQAARPATNGPSNPPQQSSAPRDG